MRQSPGAQNFKGNQEGKEQELRQSLEVNSKPYMVVYLSAEYRAFWQ